MDKDLHTSPDQGADVAMADTAGEGPLMEVKNKIATQTKNSCPTHKSQAQTIKQGIITITHPDGQPNC